MQVINCAYKIQSTVYWRVYNLDFITIGFIPFRSVGTSTAAFALAILEGSTRPGVWFPEEVCIINHLQIKTLLFYS
jgi:hypothetical protein